jgi:hypothetical protein
MATLDAEPLLWGLDQIMVRGTVRDNFVRVKVIRAGAVVVVWHTQGGRRATARRERTVTDERGIHERACRIGAIFHNDAYFL